VDWVHSSTRQFHSSQIRRAVALGSKLDCGLGIRLTMGETNVQFCPAQNGGACKCSAGEPVPLSSSGARCLKAAACVSCAIHSEWGLSQAYRVAGYTKESAGRWAPVSCLKFRSILARPRLACLCSRAPSSGPTACTMSRRILMRLAVDVVLRTL
jgi:hypothetical protein